MGIKNMGDFLIYRVLETEFKYAYHNMDKPFTIVKDILEDQYMEIENYQRFI